MENGRDNDPDRDRVDIYRTQELYKDTQTDIYGGYDTDYDITDQDMRSGQTYDEYTAAQNDEHGKPARPAKKKKKRRKKHYFLRFLVLVALIAGAYVFLTSPVFSIDQITVEGNTLMSDDDIIKQSGVKVGDNMFEQTGRKVKAALTENKYIADVKVSRELPNIYKIKITERMPVIAVSYNGKYIILDEEGYAVDEADSTMHATLVTGLKINKYELGHVPEFDDSANFKEASRLIKAVNDSGMFFKKVELGSSMNVKGYVADTMVCSGQSSDIISQLEEIKAVLYDLDQKDIKRGIIRVGSDNYISFSPITE